LEGRTHVCCIRLGRFVVRGERLIKLGNSWFSAKFIEVKRYNMVMKGRACCLFGEGKTFTEGTKTSNIHKFSCNRQNVSEKIHIREGKSPERKLRF
jgi:hypothetical protein